MAAVSQTLSDLAGVEAHLAPHGLCVLGGFHEGTDTLLLVGPDEPGGFWSGFKATHEATDGKPDPLDRWSSRVLGALASHLGGEVLLPFGGPPWHPFQSWAVRTGRIHESPVRLLVHDRAGLWVSFRGALRLPGHLALPPVPAPPCPACETRPCLAACPAGALDGAGYDVPRCKAYLGANPTGACMTEGCQVRAACPVSRGWERTPAQSAFHMAAFVGS